MHPLFVIGVQIGLLLVPVILFVGLKKQTESIPLRLVMAVIVAGLGGALAYYLAAVHGWRPLASGGGPVRISPTTLAAVHVGGLLFTCVVLSVAKPRTPAGPKKR